MQDANLYRGVPRREFRNNAYIVKVQSHNIVLDAVRYTLVHQLV